VSTWQAAVLYLPRAGGILPVPSALLLYNISGQHVKQFSRANVSTDFQHMI